MNHKIALVTGASSGIGTAVTKVLLDGGYAVMAAGRNQLRTEELRSLPGNIETWVGDLDSADSCKALMKACIDHFGQLDLLVNNAGIYQAANAEATPDELWHQTIAVNLSSAFFLSRAALPLLRKTRGAIVNIASDWGLAGGHNAVAYCASKGGMVLMTRAMALDHAAEGIRVNAVCPGDVDTPMLYREGSARGLNPGQALAESAAGSPTGAVTAPEDVAALVAYLASDAARQITGAAIPIDGGNTA